MIALPISTFIHGTSYEISSGQVLEPAARRTSGVPAAPCAARLGLLALSAPRTAFGIVESLSKRFARMDSLGGLHISGICPPSGLGGNPYRDGSFECCVEAPPVEDDLREIAPLVRACVEIIRAQSA